MGIRNRFDDSAYQTTLELFDRNEPILQRGMGIHAPKNRQPRKETPEFFHSVPKIAWFLGRKFQYAILPFCKLRMKCQCGPCTFPWHKASRRISVKDCEFDPLCRACRDTRKAFAWASVIFEWFLMHNTDREIEMVHHWKPGTVNQIVQKIRRQIRGERQDGLPRTGNPRGRPKRKIDPSCGTVGDGEPAKC